MTPTASAGTIFGTGSPYDAIPGGTVIDFDSTAAEPGLSKLEIKNVTLVSDTKFNIGDGYRDLYNTSGRAFSSPEGGKIWLNFTTTVDAFAFNMGGHDLTWTLRGYSSDGNLIDSLVIAAIHSNNNGEYYGITGSGISYGILSTSDPMDYILLDNITYNVAVIPVPAALPLFLTGLAGLGFLARRRKKHSL